MILIMKSLLIFKENICEILKDIVEIIFIGLN